jgi:hypothetical protein
MASVVVCFIETEGTADMFISIRTAGLVSEYGNIPDLGLRYAQLATQERQEAKKASTQKQARYHEGKASAYDLVAKELMNALVGN